MRVRRLAAYLFLLISPFFGLARPAPAQTSRRSNTDLYGFFSPLGTGSDLGAGLGVERYLRAGFYVNLDVAAESPNWTFSFGHDQPGYGLASADLAYHFFSSGKRPEPFVEGGYSLDFGHRVSSSGNTFNLGAGVDVWFTRQLAFRPRFDTTTMSWTTVPIGGS